MSSSGTLRCVQNDLNEIVGNRIASLRAAKGFTQDHVAKLLSDELGRKVDPTTVTRTEKGKRPIPVTDLQAYANIFDTQPEMLLTGEGDWSISRQLQGAVERFDNAIRSFLGAWGELISSRQNLRSALLNFQKYATSENADHDPMREQYMESAELMTNLSFSDIRKIYGINFEDFDDEE